ncbi:MAG: hypothetical protein NTW96_10825 [Planctomycetia bacterium]|nr:hypothetical protein [Planctomycetia bacterium]
MKHLLPMVLGTLLFAATPLQADDAALADRLGQLESETQVLRTELQWLREHPVRLPQVEAAPVSMSAPAQTDEDTYTFDQVQAMMTSTAKKYAWTKGDFTVTPYGFLWGNMVYETERSNDGDTTLYVYSPETNGDKAFHLSAQATRLGIDVAGPRLRIFNCAPSGGKVELDFFGSFITENKGSVLLRHAYWEVKDDDFRLLMGQTWDVISPLYPNTIMYSVYWGAGNIGYRRAQLRGERFLKFSDTSLVTLQSSLNVDVVTDFTATDDDIQGDHSAWPLIEGRAAWTVGHRGKGDLPTTVGFSGHIGEQVFDTTIATLPPEFNARTWSCNADLNMPITETFGVHGEFFTGENLGAFLGGILQGVNIATGEPIRATGGWGEVWWDWAPQWQSNVGYTLDDPLDSDLTAASARIYNQAYYANVIYAVTKQFKLGFEVSQWTTLYKDRTPGESTRFEFMGKYGF